MNRCEINRLPPRVILWGGTGAAKEARPILEHYGAKVVAIFDDTPELPSPFPDVPIFRGETFRNWIASQKRQGLGFCLTIGNPHGRIRLKLHEMLTGEGLTPVTFAHSSAVIADDVIVGEGAQILAGAILEPEVAMGRQCIVNSGAVVCHETVMKEGSEIGPGAIVCGAARMGVNTWIGAGATILPRLIIGDDAIVGAGAVVTKDVKAGTTVAGIPARPMNRRKG